MTVQIESGVCTVTNLQYGMYSECRKEEWSACRHFTHFKKMYDTHYNCIDHQRLGTPDNCQSHSNKVTHQRWTAKIRFAQVSSCTWCFLERPFYGSYSWSTSNAYGLRCCFTHMLIDLLNIFTWFPQLPKLMLRAPLINLYIQNGFRLNGLSSTIVCDRDSKFVSAFFKEVFQKLGANLLFNTAHHPQTVKPKEWTSSSKIYSEHLSIINRIFGIDVWFYVNLQLTVRFILVPVTPCFTWNMNNATSSTQHCWYLHVSPAVAL